MAPLFAPYRVHSRFACRRPRRPDALPVPWAVEIENVRAAPVAVDCLKTRVVSREEFVVGPRRRAYIRWTD